MTMERVHHQRYRYLINKRLLVSILFALFCTIPSYAYMQNDEEHIAAFKSHIMVNPDASIDVAEEITAYAEGDAIKHGLVRWLPLTYTDSYGIRHQADYRVRQILVNNHRSPYHIKRTDGQFAIYIGDRQILLSPGLYTYTIQYHVNDAINFLQNGDELYWNITGNQWHFPIRKVYAFIRLPEGASILSYHGYTGETGDSGSDYTVKPLSDNQIEFETGYLPPKSGLTIAVAWPKGFVHEPTLIERLSRSFEYSRGQYLIFEITLLVFFYYLIVWNWYGRDPCKGTIVPLFSPPTGFSPAAIRYIMRMGFDMKGFTAAIISMATKGAISLSDTTSQFILKKNNDSGNLATEEKQLYQTLFTKSNHLELSPANAALFKKAKNTLHETLANQYQEVYFITNSIYLIPGILLTALAFATAILAADDPSNAGFAILWLSIWTIACFFLLYSAYHGLRQLIIYFTFTHLIRCLFLFAFALPFLGGEVAGLTLLSTAIPIFTIPLLLFTASLNVIYYHLMKQPTKEGRQLMDSIEGFKMFLATTERYRLEHLQPPNVTPAIFEKWLPYAIALDVEQAWGEHFNNELTQAGIEPNRYQPGWYTGSNWSTTSLATFPAYLSSRLDSSLATTTVSSSASGGGGSSGGGGGGGGGGGW